MPEYPLVARSRTNDGYLGQGKEKLWCAGGEQRAISIISWMEVLVGTTADDEAAIRRWLSSFHVIGLNGEIASRAVEIRKQRRIRLPDAIVWASADINSMLLVSRNTKDFPADEPGVRVPYKV
jgi:predicted nucleic acid-binding protein